MSDLIEFASGPAATLTLLLLILCGITVVVFHVLRITAKIVDASALAIWKRISAWDTVLYAVSFWKEMRRTEGVMSLSNWMRFANQFDLKSRAASKKPLTDSQRRWLDAIEAFEKAANTSPSTPYYAPQLNIVNAEHKAFLDEDAKAPRTSTGEYYHEPVAPIVLELVPQEVPDQPESQVNESDL